METLSDKIVRERKGWGLKGDLKVEDVKEFIRKLKEAFEIDGDPGADVDRLAGDKLT